MSELKMLKDFMKGEMPVHDNCVLRLRQEAIKIFRNLQSPDTIYPLILENFPDLNKGSIAKKRWNDTDFRYGAEYGMLAILLYFFNITEAELND